MTALPSPREHLVPARPHFRALALRGRADLRALAAFRRPLDPVAPPEGGPIASVAGGPIGELGPPDAGEGWTTLSLAREGAAALPLTLLVPPALERAITGARRRDGAGPDAAGLLALEIALEEVMDALDAAFGAPMEIVAEAGPASGPPSGRDAPATRRPRDHWRPLTITLTDGGRHDVWLGADRAALAPLAAAAAGWPGRRRPPAIRLPAAVEVGGIDLSSDALARLRPGDTMLPGAGGIDLGRGGLVLAGRVVARAVLGAEGAEVKEMGMADDDVIEEDQAGLRELPVRVGFGAEDDDPAGEGGPAGLRELPVRVAFRLPARDMTLAEITALGPGSVVPLEIDEDAPLVDISVGGRVVGRGEVVSISGRLAVHVLRLPGLR